jgi:acyl carrier protein
MDLNIVETKLIGFIKKEFMVGNDFMFDSDTKLVSSGIIDSFSLVSLQRFIEIEFSLKIPSSKFTENNFDTINNMIGLLKKYL